MLLLDVLRSLSSSSKSQLGLSAALVAGACYACSANASSVPAGPMVDYHQHLVSPAFAEIAKVAPMDGVGLVKKLDEANVRKAVVLSMGYTMADERKGLSDPDRRTREENDWTSRQVALSRGRLIGFCGVNPLRDDALSEVRRCLRLPGMRGLKLHFGNSGVSLRNEQHLDRLRSLFVMLGEGRVPILVHMRARGGLNFGAPDARIFIEALLPSVVHSEVIVAHFGGAGPGYPEQADEVMSVFADAAARHDRRLRRTYFDFATILTAASSDDEAKLIARRVRQVGPSHVVYGSDLLLPGSPTIKDTWRIVETRLGLTPTELRTIASNKLTFLR